MVTAFNFFLTLSIILALALMYSIYMNIKLGLTILKFEDAVEESLDIIDERYGSISKILEMPIFFDSIEVRQVVTDIKITRDALLVIANMLSETENSLSKSQKNIADVS